jgi:hypothetical protein
MKGRLAAILVSALLLAPSCREVARHLGAGPAGAAAATALVDALRGRYGTIKREPSLEKVRPKLAAAALVPSRVFDDGSVWTASEGEWRALWLEGGGAPGAYRLGIRAAPALPRAPGDYRARIALRRQASGRFEWDTFDELALGPVRSADLAGAFHALLRGAEAEARGDARGHVTAAMPRSARALGRLFDLEVLALLPDAPGTRRVDVALRLRPDRLKETAPRFAAYISRRARGVRMTAAVRLPDGRVLWSAEVQDDRWRLRMRTSEGRLVPLEGAPSRPPGPLRATMDYSFKAGLFRVGLRGLNAQLDAAPGRAPLGVVVRLAQPPDWQMPFLVEPFMRASLNYPFEAPGSTFSLALREEDGRGSLLVSDSTLRVRESWIVKWLGGFSDRAMAELRASEAEADAYALECLTAVRDDLAALVAAAPPRGPM